MKSLLWVLSSISGIFILTHSAWYTLLAGPYTIRQKFIVWLSNIFKIYPGGNPEVDNDKLGIKLGPNL